MRKEATTALVNAITKATDYQIFLIEKIRGLEALAHSLNEKNITIIKEALDGVDEILMRGEGGEEDENEMVMKFDTYGGQEILEELLMSFDDDIAKKSLEIMEKYYMIDTVEEIKAFRELGYSANTEDSDEGLNKA